jgi:hypothetical protein
MATILDRSLAPAQTADVRKVGGPVLRAIIDRGVGVFERCSHTAPDGDRNLAVLMPLHLILEMLDGTEVSLDSSCVVASRAALRSAFEASLGLKYVLQADYERRSMAYVVSDLKERIQWYEEMDPRTPAGQRLREDMGLSAEAQGFPFPPPEHCRERAESLRNLLNSGEFVSVSTEYETASKGRRRVPWYSLFGGPKNVRELAIGVHEGQRYLILYREWSKTVHGMDLTRLLTARSDGSAAVRVIRNPVSIPTVYLLACHIGLEAADAVLQHYRPGESEQSARWFMTEISPGLKQLDAIDEVDEP